MTSFKISKEDDTALLASRIVAIMRGGLSFGLSGELGAGKTTLVRHVLSACGGDARSVSSPTYTLQHEYRLPSGLVVEHWDLYRLSSLPHELEEATPSTAIRFIEWPERCPEIISTLSCHLKLSHDLIGGSSTARRLEISGFESDLVSASIRCVLEEA